MRKNQAAFYAFFVGVFLSGVVINFILRANHYQNWPKVEAEITQQEHYNSRGEARKVDFEYQYKINNSLHNGDETLYESDFNLLVTGSWIKVAYNPDAPEDNIVYASIGYGTYTLMSSVFMFFAMGIYYLVITKEHYESLLKRHYDKDKF